MRLERAVCADVMRQKFAPTDAMRQDLFRLLRLDSRRHRECSLVRQSIEEPGAEPQAFVVRLLEKRDVKGALADLRGDDEAAERPRRGEVEQRILERWSGLAGNKTATIVAKVARVVLTYEHLSQILTGAFGCLQYIAHRRTGSSVGVDDAVADPKCRKVLQTVCDELPSVLEKLEGRTDIIVEIGSRPASWESDDLTTLRSSIGNTIAAFSGRHTPGDLVGALARRHEAVQAKKHKAVWFLREGSRFRLLGEYQRPQPPTIDRGLLHAFRLVNAALMMRDLRR